MTDPSTPTGQHEAAAFAALNAYLAANPAMTWRDWHGNGFAPFDKTLSAPGAPTWDQLNPSRVRDLATSTPARFLSREVRQAASRDPKLTWDEATRAYRRAGERQGSPEKAVSAAPAPVDPEDDQRAYGQRSAGSEDAPAHPAPP